MANPLDHEAIVDVQFASSRDVRPVVACRSEILVGLERHYPPPPPPRPEVVEPESENAPAVQMLNQIVLDAIKWQASDIHIEPGPSDVHVRLCVDGVLRDDLQFPRWMRRIGATSRS